MTFETEEAVDEVCSIQYHDIRNKKVTSMHAVVLLFSLVFLRLKSRRPFQKMP